MMRKILSSLLAVITIASVLVSCAPMADQLDPAITLASSSALANAEWLNERLETIPDDVVIGIGTNENYGIDMEKFEPDGYILREMDGQIMIFGKSETGLDLAVRKYAKAVQNGTSGDLDVTYHEGVRVEKLEIADNPIEDYVVVYSEGDPRIPRLGQAMANYIKTACGVTIPAVAADEKPTAEHYIYVSQVEDATLKETGCRYRVDENGDVYIEGAFEMGVANGIYTFLEDQLGWEDLYFGDSVLQEADYINVPAGASAEYIMAFDYLHPRSYKVKTDQVYFITGVVTHCQHAIQNWTDHTDPWKQICYTDENIYLTAIDRVYTHVSNAVAAGQRIGYDITAVHLGQVDAFGYCKCSDCLKVYREEGNTEAGPVIRWMNRLAQEMEDSGLGGVKYATYAYHGSNRPCKTAPHDDVYVTFCTDGHCSVHTLNGGECTHSSFDMGGTWGDVELNNFDYAEWLEGWAELTDNLYVWFYALDNDFNQYTVTPQMYDDFKFFIELGVKGVYWQHPDQYLGIIKLDHRLVYRMNQNPDMTEEEFWLLCDEYLEKIYGEGSHYIRELMNIWDEMENRGPCGNCWDYGNVNSGHWSYDRDYYLENWEYMLELLDKARYMADSKAQEDAIDMLSVTFLYMGCAFTYFEAYDNEDTETLELLDARYTEMINILNRNGHDPVVAGMTLGDTQNVKIYGTLDEMAWRTWIDARAGWAGFRDEEETNYVGREMPEEWVEWYETSTAEPSA